MSRTPNASTRKRKPALGLDPLTWMREDDAAAEDSVVPRDDDGPRTGTEGASAPATAAAGSPIVLDAEMGIGSSSALYERLAAALATDGPLRLDGAAVESVDGAALQLLTAFCREAVSRGRPVEWSGVSRRLAESVRITGLAGPLGIPAATA